MDDQRRSPLNVKYGTPKIRPLNQHRFVLHFVPFAVYAAVFPEPRLACYATPCPAVPGHARPSLAPPSQASPSPASPAKSRLAVPRLAPPRQTRTLPALPLLPHLAPSCRAWPGLAPSCLPRLAPPDRSGPGRSVPRLPCQNVKASVRAVWSCRSAGGSALLPCASRLHQ